MARTKGEDAFIDQRTRQLLTLWADHCIRQDGGVPDPLSVIPGTPETEAQITLCVRLGMHREYVEFAVTKGWLGKTVKDGRRQLTAAGWNTAAAFLKR